MAAVMRRVFGALCAVTIVVAVAACTDTSAPSDSPTPAPTTTPVFSSDKEALAAAKKAYAKYLKVSDEIAHDGGKDPERIKKYAVGEALKSALQGFEQYRSAGAHSTGSTSYANVKLERAAYEAADAVHVAFYVCEDVSNVNVVDAQGHSLVSPDRKPKTPFQITTTFDSARRLVVASRVVWKGDGVCM